MDDIIFNHVREHYEEYKDLRLIRPVRELDPDTFERIVKYNSWVPFDLRYEDNFANEKVEKEIEFLTPYYYRENQRTDNGKLEKDAWSGCDYYPHWEGGWEINCKHWIFPPKVVYFPVNREDENFPEKYSYWMSYEQIAFWRSLGFAEAVPLK